MTDLPTKSSFAARLGDTFRVQPDPGPPIDLVLVHVSRAAEEPERPFSLIFHGQPEPWLPQRTYPTTHGAFGTFDLFLVPVGPDPQTRQMRYEAVFN